MTQDGHPEARADGRGIQQRCYTSHYISFCIEMQALAMIWQDAGSTRVEV